MKKTRRILAILLSLALILPCVSCGEESAGTIRVIALKGPTGMGLVGLMEQNEAGTAKNAYSFTLTANPSDAQAAILSGEADIAALPVNLAAVLYNKGEDVRFAAVNTLGVLSILENGTEIQSIADLRGRTVYATGQGSTPQYVLEHLLLANGLVPGEDVFIEYCTEHAELATKLAADDVAVGLLPEPNVTVALKSAAAGGNGSLRIALDVTEEWEKLGEGSLVQGCIVIKGAFWDAHPKAVERFLEEYKASADGVVADPAGASLLIEKYGIVANAALAESAIPHCNICCITGEEGIADMKGILGVLYAANPKSVGGSMPDEAFYGQ